jgi:hypothetical protein
VSSRRRTIAPLVLFAVAGCAELPSAESASRPPFATAVAQLHGPLAALQQLADRTGRSAQRVAHPLAQRRAAEMPPLRAIGASWRGAVLRWDPARRDFVRSTRPDDIGPADGVRLIAYAPAPDGAPDVTRELGHDDLLALDTDAAARTLRWRAVRDTTPVGDYLVRQVVQRIAADRPVTTRLIEGDLGVGTDRSVFTLERRVGPGADTLRTARIELPAQAVELRIDQRIDSDGTESRRVTLLAPTDEVVIEWRAAGDTLSARLVSNGVVLALIAGDRRDPALLGADGRPLDPAAHEAVRGALAMADALITVAIEFGLPADTLLALADQLRD